MTTLSRSSRPADLGTLPERAPASTITVRWAISRAALHRSRPDLAPPRGPSSIFLEWRLRIDAAGAVSGEALLRDHDHGIPILSLLPSRALRDGDLLHIDIADLLRLTTRACGPLYAQTGLFHEWTLPGGRYELFR